MTEPPAPVADQVRRVADRTPDAIAVSGVAESVTYRELVERADGVTAQLRDAGVGPGDAVAVRMTPGPWHTATVLGAFGAGGYVVCLSPSDLGERDKAALRELRPACLVTDGELATDEFSRWFNCEVHAGSGDSNTTRAYVAFTSGSTGAPKGIPMTHESLAQLVGWMSGELGLGPGSRVAQWAAPAYDASLVETFLPLVAGATLCPVPPKQRANPDKIARWLADERVSVFQTVPSFARAVVKAIAREGTPLDDLRALLLAGEPLPAELADQLREVLPGARLLNLYGPTESILATWHEVSSPVRGTTPIGKAIPGRQVLVLDEHDDPCPPGVTGEIVICSPHITAGYLGAERANRTPFRPPAGLDRADRRWYRTGDRGTRRFDGVLEFGGRADAQVKLAGQRLELAEVESALAADDAVAECAVVPQRSVDGIVSRLHAYVVTEAAASQLRAVLRARFGRTLLPVTFTVVTELPRNVGGKVDRRALSSTSSRASTASTTQPVTPVRPAHTKKAESGPARQTCEGGSLSAALVSTSTVTMR